MALRPRLRHTATIQRATHGARNAYGVPAETWATLATVRCWYQPATRTEQEEASSGGAVREDGLVFMLPTDITEADRLVISGVTYDVTSVHDPAGKGQHYEVTVKMAETV